MSNLRLEQIDNLVYIEIDPVYSVHIKKDLITGVVVDTGYISIHFIDGLLLSDFKIPIGKIEDLSKSQLEFLQMLNQDQVR